MKSDNYTFKYARENESKIIYQLNMMSHMISYINKHNYLWVRRLYLLYAEFKYCQGLYLDMHRSRKESKGKAIAKAFITDL